MPTPEKINVLTSLAELEQYFDKLSMQVAREAQREFEVKLMDDLIACGNIELIAELREIFYADA